MAALDYLHKQKILHWDLKLDNILLSDWYEVKLCDFGVSKKIKDEEKLTERIGTLAYMAPEVFNQAYKGFKSDYWSLGVAIFILMNGKAPF